MMMALTQNSTDPFLLDDEQHEHLLDNTVVRVVLVLIYSVVFFFCFFGNLAVVLVLTLHWRMRGVTKFCLGNLAFANLCVGIFCVYQNLFQYLMESWIFGNFLCKLYHFTNSLSHTASILILVVICVERYLVILHPFKCRRSLTMQRLRILMTMVWIVSAVLCSPRLYYINTIRVSLDGPSMNSGPGTGTGQEHESENEQAKTYEVICVAEQNLYDSHSADIIYFVLLFALPLLIISILYTKIALFLKKNDILSTGMYPKGMNRGKRFYALNPNLSESETTRSEPEQSLTERNNYSYRIKNSITNLQTCASTSRKSKSTSRLIIPSAYLQIVAKFDRKGKAKSNKSTPLPFCDIPNYVCGDGVNIGLDSDQCLENIEMKLIQTSGSSTRHNSSAELLTTTERVRVAQTVSTCHDNAPKLQLTFSNNFCEDKIVQFLPPSQATQVQGQGQGTGGCDNSRSIFKMKKCTFPYRSRKMILKENPNNSSNKAQQKMQLKTLMKSKSYQRWKWQQCRQANYDKGRSNRNCGRNWRQISNRQFCISRDAPNVNPNSNSFELNDNGFVESKTILNKASSLIYCCCECAFSSSRCNTSTISHANSNSNDFISHMNNIRSDSISPIPIMVESCVSRRTLSLGDELAMGTPCSMVSGGGCGSGSGSATCIGPGTDNANVKCNGNGNGNGNANGSGSGTGTGTGTSIGTGSVSSNQRYGRRLNRIRTFHPRPRQAVVRMLIIIVATFALCNLPFHLRKLCQNHLPVYYFESDISDLVTPVTYILMYANCAINPILYAFIFKSFRSSFKDLVTCRWRRTRYLK